MQGTCILSSADSALKAGDTTAARAAYEQGRQIFSAVDAFYEVGMACRALARLADGPEARRSLIARAHAAWSELDNPELMVQLSRDFNDCGEAPEADRHGGSASTAT